jgi:hypothetical protein
LSGASGLWTCVLLVVLLFEIKACNGKNKVAIFAGLVAKKARLVHGLVVGFAVSELSGLGEGDPSIPM